MHDVFMEKNARIRPYTYMETANIWVGQMRCGRPYSIINGCDGPPCSAPMAWSTVRTMSVIYVALSQGRLKRQIYIQQYVALGF